MLQLNNPRSTNAKQRIAQQSRRGIPGTVQAKEAVASFTQALEIKPDC